MRPLKMKKKLSEFYGAPITKFYSHSIAYLVFLGLYTYICLVRKPFTSILLTTSVGQDAALALCP